MTFLLFSDEARAYITGGSIHQYSDRARRVIFNRAFEHARDRKADRIELEDVQAAVHWVDAQEAG